MNNIRSTASRVRVDASRLQRAAAVADEAVRQWPYPSAVLGVANAERVLLKHAVSKPGRAPAREDGIFLLASITKPIVATAIMRLVEDGRMLLSDPVAKHTPEFAVSGKENVTVLQILTHASGLDESEWVRELTERRRATLPELVNMALRSKLVFEPGTHCAYNSFAFYVLAELIARLSGLPYAEYLHRAIFRPLGMRDTTFAPDAESRTRAMPVYGDGIPDFDRQLAYYTSIAFAGGGLWSTLNDLVVLGQAFLRGGRYADYQMLSPAGIATMTRLHTAGMKETWNGRTTPARYGLGWAKPDPGSLASIQAYRHGGATGTLLLIDPEWDLVFVFLTNQWGIQASAPDQALNVVYSALRRE